MIQRKTINRHIEGGSVNEYYLIETSRPYEFLVTF